MMSMRFWYKSGMVIVETFLLHKGLNDCSLVGGGWFVVCFYVKT